MGAVFEPISPVPPTMRILIPNLLVRSPRAGVGEGKAFVQPGPCKSGTGDCSLPIARLRRESYHRSCGIISDAPQTNYPALPGHRITASRAGRWRLRSDQARLLELRPQLGGDRKVNQARVLLDLRNRPRPRDHGDDGRVSEDELESGGLQRHLVPLTDGGDASRLLHQLGLSWPVVERRSRARADRKDATIVRT